MEPSPGCPVSHQHHPMILYPHHHHTILCPAHHNHHHTKSCPLHHHHHHHHHYTISCPLHHHHHHHYLLTHHSHVSPTLAPLESTTAPNETHHSGNPALQEQEYEQLQEEEAKDDEEDEPVFVLTDEWREFFAKSEAKRKLEKKQAKKKQKN